MTIIQPNKNKILRAADIMLICLGAAAFGVAAATVFSYAQVAGLKHEISAAKSEMERSKSASADLSNRLFRITDPQSLEAIAAEKGLVEDRNPKWVFASL